MKTNTGNETNVLNYYYPGIHYHSILLAVKYTPNFTIHRRIRNKIKTYFTLYSLATPFLGR